MDRGCHRLFAAQRWPLLFGVHEPRRKRRWQAGLLPGVTNHNNFFMRTRVGSRRSMELENN